MHPWLVDGVLVAALVPALVFDLRFRRIPHWLTLPAAAAGLVLAGLFGGLGAGWDTPGLRSALLGGCGAYALFGAVVVCGGLGGGDAALMGAVGSLVGYPAVVGATALVAIVGGIQGAVAVLARTRPGRAVCARLGMKAASSADFGKAVPYGVAIATGTLTLRLWQHLAALPPGQAR